MKLEEIKKLNEEMSMQSKDMIFFKNLYHHCIKVLEMVPDGFIKIVFGEAYQNGKCINYISIGEDIKSGGTYVSFYVLDRDDNISRKEYVVQTAQFDFRDIFMSIDLDKKEIVDFGWLVDDIDYSCNYLKKLFGKYLIDIQNYDENIFSVSSKCFY